MHFLGRFRILSKILGIVVLLCAVLAVCLSAVSSPAEPVIREIERISKPGRRVYVAVRNLPRINNGLGVAILSTPKGVMADHDAREANVGGEIICTVF